MIDGQTYARMKLAERRLEIALAALNKIASWNEGEIVTAGFDSPADAQTARNALKLIKLEETASLQSSIR